MDFNEFLNSVLTTGEGGPGAFQFGIAPVHLGGLTLFRLDNLTINIQSKSDVSNPELLPSPDRVRKRDDPESAASLPPSLPTEQPIQDANAPIGNTPYAAPPPSDSKHRPKSGLAVPYRLDPLLVFDSPPTNDQPHEFEVGPRFRVNVKSPKASALELTQFGPVNRKRSVCFDGLTPVGIRHPIRGNFVPFNQRRKARLNVSEQWSFRTFPRDKPVPVTLPDKPAGFIAVFVDGRHWQSSWLLNRRDPQGRIKESFFLVLQGQ